MRFLIAFATVMALAACYEQARAQQQLPLVTVTPPPPPKRPPKATARAKRASASTAAANAGALTLPVSGLVVPGAPNIGSGPTIAPNLASQLTVPGEELNARPTTRPGEILEAAPGLIVTQHSGEGKANQYLLRGYNLDHGTDMAIFIDGMPVNMPTHAHGQGYADLNWLMPETVNSVAVRKGPYFADVGDFGSAGNLSIDLLDASKSIAQVTLGSFGYERLFAMSSAKLGTGNFLAAAEVATYNGPWINPDEMRKLNGFLRYTQGTVLDGFSITGMAYSNRWNSTDQVPERAITSGQLPRFGAEDPSDGGNTSRFSLSGRLAKSDDAGSWRANAYVIQSSLDLFNDFTYFLNNPPLGDQFHQHDDRVVAGANVARTLKGSLGAVPAEVTVGVQSRYDAINLGLTDTYQRTFLSNIRSDQVSEGSVGIYAENTLRWSPWFRTTLGWRGDVYSATVDSIYDVNNSGHVQASIGSPKFSLVLGPFNNTEFFLGAGMGMHSNDARGATITEAPTDPSTKLTASPLLVRTEGAEVGVRSKAIAGLDTSVSLFILNQASEIVFQGDSGDTSASRPSQRYGIEWTNKYGPYSWIMIDGDLAISYARFVGFDTAQAISFASLAGYPEAQIGNAPGSYIPNAPAIVASAGLTLGEKTGWFGSLRWRYLGATPLTEDNAFRSPAVSIVNGRAGYRFDNGWAVRLDALNLLNAKTNQITYAYGSLLRTDSLFNLCFPVQVAPAAVCQNGVMDHILHPIEPLALRLTLTATF